MSASRLSKATRNGSISRKERGEGSEDGVGGGRSVHLRKLTRSPCVFPFGNLLRQCSVPRPCNSVPPHSCCGTQWAGGYGPGEPFGCASSHPHPQHGCAARVCAWASMGGRAQHRLGCKKNRSVWASTSERWARLVGTVASGTSASTLWCIHCDTFRPRSAPLGRNGCATLHASTRRTSGGRGPPCTLSRRSEEGCGARSFLLEISANCKCESPRVLVHHHLCAAHPITAALRW